ncbi:DUF6382 domain-containing protein [Kineothrix sp. MB12-C1]|uniref:DUF6382 domain-containing protein n=1 Tax=Kineothrix sp. MB12-C1 TaxID=3070215 RepID=UPI0027D2D349|nr:DUF6382 domain-containing protein [Kineothrix sp. MB12-C1]WMC94340.1 DUF6382 domain-containing protein [Kineothrix sp. MB12-C1]
MLDAKYYKDLSHNYLILKEDAEGVKNEYQNRMLIRNRMRTLLPCSIRSINDEVYFYYEISSKQSIKIFYESSGISYKQVYCLFEYIYEASKEIKEYLLEDNYLLLYPEFIYINPEEQTYFFVYYPIECNAEVIPIMGLAEFLLERTDREDEKLTNIIYKIYERIQDGNFILPEILLLFDESCVNRISEPHVEMGQEILQSREYRDCEEVDNHIIKGEYEKADPDSTGRSNDILLRNETGRNLQHVGEDERTWWDEKESEEEESAAEIKGNMIISTILLVLCIGAIIGIICIRYFYVLSIEESILTIAGIITLIIVSAFLILSLIMAPIRKKNGYTKKEVGEEEEIQPVNQYMAVDTYFKENMDKRSQTSYGSTVFIESSLYNLENKLYGINKGNKYHIDLNKLPCTVGKMAGNVDVVIKNDTISRIHARFMKEGEIIYVTDLNSTNGTFKNGLRLEPNETVSIEAGDEIRFGKMTFCYR